MNRFATLVPTALTHGVRGARRRREARTATLVDRLEAVATEAEARELLLTHAGRVLPSAGAVMLTSQDGADRLEPVFGERVAATPLRGLLVGHPEPEVCLAIRLGRVHRRTAVEAADPGSECTLCGGLVGESVCAPLRAGGQVFESLLLASVDPISTAAGEELRDATARAAPVIALHRALAAAEHRSARDPLTGLANRRGAQDALARLSAQAGRTITPLAAVLVDLDHFAAVNHRVGPERGDRALARVAGSLATGIRASDFLARFGGQAFLVLAPDTGRFGAAELAEKLRRKIEALELPDAGPLTVSVGVASVPEDAAAGDELVRRAERALGIAKALGRNRVAGPEPSAAAEG